MIDPEKYIRHMFENDTFSQWLGLDVHVDGPGAVTGTMKVRNDMLNGFNICHGGITFSLADSILAFASNMYGKVAVSIEASMAYPNPVIEGDLLIATSREVSRSEKIGVYTVSIAKDNGTPVGEFRGVVYITKKDFGQ